MNCCTDRQTVLRVVKSLFTVIRTILFIYTPCIGYKANAAAASDAVSSVCSRTQHINHNKTNHCAN